MMTITREAAVGRIRTKLIDMSEDGKSMCEIAAEKNILCRGFHRDSADELRKRYAGKIPNAANLCRSDLEQLANEWQLNRQRRERTLLSCDVQYMFYETCRAWDDFTNEDLARFCRELTGKDVAVRGPITLPVI